MALKMTKTDLQAFLVDHFPQVAQDFTVIEVTDATTKIRMHISDSNLRPGGTVSGPSMFTLADVSIYLTILAKIGPKALAVTTSCSIDFMRKPAAHADLIATARLLKLGRVLAVGDVLIHSENQADPVARASLTYSIPPNA